MREPDGTADNILERDAPSPGGFVTFKDLLRLIRRRWLVAVATFALVLLGYLALSVATDKTLYRARTRVQIKTPPIFITASQGSQFITIEQTSMETWLSFMQGPEIRNEARDMLSQKKGYTEKGAVPREWFDSVAIQQQAGTELVWIEATASSPEIAVDVANTMADACEEWSVKHARKEINEAIKNVDDRRAEAGKLLNQRRARAQEKRDDARVRFGSDRLEFDVDDLRQTLQGHDKRRRELDRRIAAVDLKLARIRKDRSMSAHLQRQTHPRFGSASLQSRVEQNAEVQRLRELFEEQHRDLRAMVRRYTEAHPKVKGLRSDIRHTELALTRAQVKAVRGDIDREEILLNTEKELAQIERKVLEPDLAQMRDMLSALTEVLDEVKKDELVAQELQTRVERLRQQLDRLDPTIKTGYISLADVRAKPQDVVPVEMRLRKSWYVAVLAAIVFGVGFAFLMEFLDTSLRNDYDVRRHLDYPVLAVVPRVRPEEVLTLQTGTAGVMTEIFDTLATVLQSLPTESPSRLYVVTSTNPQEGKTAVSTNLAVALARQGKRTLLVDGDLRVPAIHNVLGLPNETGLSDLLLVQMTLTGTEGLLREADIPNLKVLTSGVVPENPYELLDAARVAPVAAQFREHFDAVVIDTPPILRAGDALKLATVADAVLFVVEAGRTEQRQATWAKRLLTSVNARVAGVLLNQAVSESEEYYYYYDRPREGSAPKAHRRS